MPGTGHSHRYKGSISNRNTKSAFQVLAPWNAKKNGEKNQVAVSTGGDNLNFKLMGAKMMSNYNDASNAWVLDCSLVVLGNKIVDGSAIIQGNVEIDGTLEVKGKVTDLSDVDICGNLRVWGKVTDLSDVDICGNLNAFTGTFNGQLTNTDQNAAGGIVTKYLHAEFAQITNLTTTYLTDVSDNILTLGNHEPINHKEMRGILARYAPQTGSADKYAFFGFDPSGLEGPTNDPSGSFVFFIDASSAILGVANETQGIPGRGVFGAIDISGGARYGGAVNGVSGQADSAMVLIGRTIIATDAGVPAKLDISGDVVIRGSTEMGKNTTASGEYSLAMGNNTSASGDESTAMGWYTTAGPNPYSTAMGIYSTASGNASTAMGNNTSAYGTNSTAMGIYSNASTNNSTAIGNRAFAGGTIQFAVGSSSATPGDLALSTSNNNKFVILQSGNVGIGTSAPVAVLDCSGDVKLTDGSGANINIASGLIHLDVNSTILGETLGQIKLTDGSGAYIDMSGGKIDISGDDVTITSTSGTSLNLLGPKINIGTADSTIDILGNVKVDTVTFVVTDISATNIDVSGNMAINGTINTLTVGFGGSDISTNTVVGYQALQDNTTGTNNVATGYQALQNNTDGFQNVAVGYQALLDNSGGSSNVATGYRALNKNTSGKYNVATGTIALYNNISGESNVAIGYNALNQNTTGDYNVAIGYTALNSNIDGSNNVAIGYNAGNGQTDISNTINIGQYTSCNASNTACIGNADITDVYFGRDNNGDCSGTYLHYGGISFQQFKIYKSFGLIATPHLNLTGDDLANGVYIEKENSAGSTNGTVFLPTYATMKTALASRGIDLDTVPPGFRFTPIQVVNLEPGAGGGNTDCIISAANALNEVSLLNDAGSGTYTIGFNEAAFITFIKVPTQSSGAKLKVFINQ